MFILKYLCALGRKGYVRWKKRKVGDFGYDSTLFPGEMPPWPFPNPLAARIERGEVKNTDATVPGVEVVVLAHT